MDTPQESAGETTPQSLSPSESAHHENENAPLAITCFTKDDSTVRYAETTSDATLDLVRKAILEDVLPRSAKTSFITTTANGKSSTIEGTLLKCAMKYPKLADLYLPVRRRAKLGLGYGILLGVFFCLLGLGLVVYMNSGNAKDDEWGEMILGLPGIVVVALLSLPVLRADLLTRGAQVAWSVALLAIYGLLLADVLYMGDHVFFSLAMLGLPICGGILYLIPERKMKPPLTQILAAIQLACAVGVMYIVFGLTQKPAIYGGFLGAVIAGGLLFGLPGMTIGGVVGAARRPFLARASDAPREYAALWIAIPLLLSAAAWAAEFLLRRNVLTPQPN